MSLNRVKKLRYSLVAGAAAILLTFSSCGQIEDESSRNAAGASETAASDETGTSVETTSVTSAETETTTMSETTTLSETTTSETTTSETTTMTDTAAAVIETTQESVPPASDNSIIPGVRLGMTIEEVNDANLNYIISEEDAWKRSETFSYEISGCDVFGIDDMKGRIFYEFSCINGQLICFGYHFGEKGSGKEREYPYSQEELKAAYDKIEAWLNANYGPSGPDNDLWHYGIKAEYSRTLDDGSAVWAVCGEDMWGSENMAPSGINEVVVSVSLPEDEIEKIKNSK